jgi:hypothetical protein
VALLVSKSELRNALVGSANKQLIEHSPKLNARESDANSLQLRIDVHLRRCGLGMRLVVQPGSDDKRPARIDHSLLKAVARGHVWYEKLIAGDILSLREIANELGVHERYVSRILRTAFLAPDIVEAIMEGRQPPQMTVERLRLGAPIAWDNQRKVFGLSAI